MKKRILALVLSMCILFSYVAFLPFDAIGNSGIDISASALNEDIYDNLISSETEFVTQLRNQLIKRQKSIKLYYASPSPCDYTTFDEFFSKTYSHDMNCPLGGDYLFWQSREREISFRLLNEEKEYIYEIEYSITFKTNEAQELYVDQQTDAILKSLNLDGKSDYEKTYLIYDYICKNVKYDHDNLNDTSYTLKYTPYAALHDGKCVCEGFSELLYIMLLKAKVDCRIITGYAGNFHPMFENNEYHAWNIVKIGDVYYNVDSTWDAGYEYWNYFMLSDETFNGNLRHGHQREYGFTTQDFYDKYPMSLVDNPYSEVLSGSCGKDGDNVKWSFVSGQLTISGEGDMISVNERTWSSEIPWSEFNNTITSVIVSEGVTSLSDCSFMNCTNLKRVSLPNTLKSIGFQCFYNCQSLVSVIIPDSVTQIGSETFLCCYALQNVVFSKNAAVIPEMAFFGCDSLTEIIIPEGVTQIERMAFSGTDKVERISIPSTLKSIGVCAFESVGFTSIYESTNLTSIYIPENIEHIGGGAFSHSAIKTITVSDDNNYYKVVDGVLYDKSGETLVNYIDTKDRTSFTVPDNVKIIDDYAFANAWYLYSITLPDSLTEIGEGAFDYCKFETINIPDSVETIGAKAFRFNLQLSEIHLSNRLTAFADEVLYGCRSLTSVSIPNSVVSIGEQSFYEVSIESISIPDSVTSIKLHAFIYCKKLKTVIIGSSIAELKRYSFYESPNIESITILNPDCVFEDSPGNVPAGGEDDCIPDDVVLYGYENSSAQKYAEKYYKRFIPIVSEADSHIHDYVESIVVPCEERTYTLHRCATCGYSYRSDYSKEVNNHTYVDIVVSPTCTEGGYTLHKCSKCEDSYKDTYTNPAGHDFDEWIVTTKPTCTEDGEEVMVCKNCGETETIVLGSTGHRLSEWQITTEPTCTACGFKTCKCENCNKTFTSLVDSLGGHDYKETVVAPTCTEEGYTLHKCSRCENSYKDSYTNPTGHSFNGWTVTTEPTCTVTGVETRKCENCDATETRDVAATGHSFGQWITTTKATCTTKGVKTRKCYYCEVTETREINALGHNYVETDTNVEPTCTAEGYILHKCSRCEDSYKEVYSEALGHYYKTTVIPPTCTTKGYTNHKCTRCNDEYNDTETDMIAHSFSDWTVTTDPTCTEKGVETRKCKNCEATESRDVDALGHDYQETVVEQTCTEEGYTLRKCSRCEDSFKDNYTEPTGHSFGQWLTTTKPTCTTTGVNTRKCYYCEATETRDISALGHNYVETDTNVEPTCTAEGYILHKCSRCEDSYKEVYSEALGHYYKTTVIPPTCTTKGYTNHKCTRCNDEYNDTETDMTAHSFGDWRVTTDLTCTAKGVETRKCKNCEATEIRDVSAIGHSFGDWDIKSYDPKTGKSKLVRKCEKCSHTETKTEKGIVQRYAGSGRFTTAAEISKGTFESAKTVVLAYGLNSADALAGVPLAAKYNAPILLTHTKTLPSETLAEIKRLGATNVIILGGEGAIGKEVENALKKEKITTKRIAGKTRFGTATAIAEQLTDTPEEIFFVYAFNFADALSASTVAAVKGAPIIYLKTNGELDADTAAYLAKVKGKVKRAYVIGGTGVISDDMMNKASKALGLDSATRVAGANRYATCIEVNNKFKDVLTGNGICVAKGLDFPDALAGGVFAALKKMPLFLADGNLKDIQSQYLGDKDISNVYIFGGTGAVPDNLVEKIAKAS